MTCVFIPIHDFILRTFDILGFFSLLLDNALRLFFFVFLDSFTDTLTFYASARDFVLVHFSFSLCYSILVVPQLLIFKSYFSSFLLFASLVCICSVFLVDISIRHPVIIFLTVCLFSEPP